MNILAVDPSLRSTGMFFIEDGAFNSDVIQLKGDRLEVMGKMLLRFANEAKGFDLLIIEDYAFGGKDRSVTVQAEIGGIIRACFAARGKPIIEVPISTWKAHAGIKLPKDGPLWKSNYLNAVAEKFKLRYQTVDEADAFLLYATVRAAAQHKIKGPGAASINLKLEQFKINAQDLG